MTKRGIIDPGHGGIDPGATGFGIQEKIWNLRISLYQHKRLNELGVDMDITRTTDVTLDSNKRTDIIRNGGYDFCISNHWNAFNGTARGVETIYPLRSNGSFARDLAEGLVDTSGIPLRRVFKRSNSHGTDYYFMHRLTGNVDVTIIEYAFMDNRTDHDWYLIEKNFYAAAESVIKDVCEYVGVPYKAPKKASQPKLDLPTVSGTLFRVQVGAFSKLNNAEDLQEQLESKNIETYLIQDQGLFKVQVGAYGKRENAEAQAKRVEANGFDTYITTASGSPAHGTKDEKVEQAAVVTASTSISRTLKAGDRVTINTSASRYATGEPIPTSRKGQAYTVMQTRSGQALLKEIMSWVNTGDLHLLGGHAPIEAGHKVVLSRTASRYATGEPIPITRKGKTYTALQTRNGQVLLKEILSWVYEKDVNKV